jgi:hypothetical protein
MTDRAAYQRAYRAARPEVRERERRASAARNRALERLAEMYCDAFDRLHDVERALVDLPPLGTSPVGRPAGKAQKRR